MASNPSVTLTIDPGEWQREVDASDIPALVAYYEMPVYAIKGETTEQYNSHLNSVLDVKPHITMDDGMDLVAMLHTRRSNLLETVVDAGHGRRRHGH